jgi:hypothetical protein
VSQEDEAYIPAELIRRVLECATPDLMLIGGQGLAFWMGTYDIHAPSSAGPAISRDVDFFTSDAANTDPLARFARAIRGRAQVNDIRNLSALVGSAVAPAEEGRVYNVDLVHSVVGLRRDRLEANAVAVPLPGSEVVLRVMHPLDVLQSRSANLHELPEKQDEVGQLQLRLAIEVARAYLEEQIEAIIQNDDITEKERQRAVFDAISTVSDYSTGDAARKNAEQYGIFLADAIPAWRISFDVFWAKQWPYLRQRMSPDYAAQCEEWSGRNFPPTL